MNASGAGADCLLPDLGNTTTVVRELAPPGRCRAPRSCRYPTTPLTPGDLPNELAVSPALREVALDRIHFIQGTNLPPSWGQRHSLSSLRLVHLSGVAGGVPAEWVDGLHGLQFLTVTNVTSLWTNNWEWLDFIASPIRTNGTGNHTGLLNVTLTHLNLAGQVHSGLFNSSKLVHLSLANNTLSGTLAAGWANSVTIPRLRTLDLSGNRIAGSLPDAWARFNLSQLALASNNLTGAWSGRVGSRGAGGDGVGVPREARARPNPATCSWLAVGAAAARSHMHGACGPLQRHRKRPCLSHLPGPPESRVTRFPPSAPHRFPAQQLGVDARQHQPDRRGPVPQPPGRPHPRFMGAALRQLAARLDDAQPGHVRRDPRVGGRQVADDAPAARIDHRCARGAAHWARTRWQDMRATSARTECISLPPPA